MKAPLESPTECLLQFFSAMNTWEKETAKRSQKVRCGKMDSSTAYDQAVSELSELFARFSIGQDARGRGPGYRIPPEYDPATEAILRVDESDESAKVFTRRALEPKEECIYHLLRSDSKWRIVKKERIDKHTGNILVCYL